MQRVARVLALAALAAAAGGRDAAAQGRWELQSLAVPAVDTLLCRVDADTADAIDVRPAAQSLAFEVTDRASLREIVVRFDSAGRLLSLYDGSDIVELAPPAVVTLMLRAYFDPAADTASGVRARIGPAEHARLAGLAGEGRQELLRGLLRPLTGAQLDSARALAAWLRATPCGRSR